MWVAGRLGGSAGGGAVGGPGSLKRRRLVGWGLWEREPGEAGEPGVRVAAVIGEEVGG